MLTDSVTYRIDFGEDFLEFRTGSGGTIEIWDIAVRSERRKGRGRHLVSLLIDHVKPLGYKRIWAITRANNFIAQQFYEAVGFRVVAPLRDFYATKDKENKSTVDAIMYGFNIIP